MSIYAFNFSLLLFRIFEASNSSSEVEQNHSSPHMIIFGSDNKCFKKEEG